MRVSNKGSKHVKSLSSSSRSWGTLWQRDTIPHDVTATATSTTATEVTGIFVSVLVSGSISGAIGGFLSLFLGLGSCIASNLQRKLEYLATSGVVCPSRTPSVEVICDRASKIQSAI